MPDQTPSTQYKSSLAKVNDMFMPMIIQQLQGNGIEMTDYQRTCVLNAMTAMSGTLSDAGLTLKDVDTSNITNNLLTIAALQVNASAQPREVYFITRRHKNKETNQYYQEIEMGIEGDGNDALLARFGRGVKQVYPFWAVREGDGFEYPKHVGIQSQPPTWTESGKGKVVRVVYPVQLTNGDVNFYIGEREDVKKNLLAHVSQNLMWDKGGAKDKFMTKADDMTLDEILDDPELVALGKISPAWSSPQARESMIVRKMRNNVVNKIPKDFSNGFVATEYEKATDESYRATRRDVTDNANSVDFDSIAKPQALTETSTTVTHPVSDVTEDGEIVTESASNVQSAPVSDSKPEPVSDPTPKKEADPF
ncbi:hypothetical protein [Lacticaseibacillus sp. GG6-2]